MGKYDELRELLEKTSSPLRYEDGAIWSPDGVEADDIAHRPTGEALVALRNAAPDLLAKAALAEELAQAFEQLQREVANECCFPYEDDALTLKARALGLLD